MPFDHHEVTHRIDHFPEGEKSFVEVPFTVGPQIERIEIGYTFPAGSGGSVVDLGLARNGRMRGWSGSERGHVMVTADRATPGYEAGPLAGDWHAVLGIVRIGPDCVVDLRIRLVPRRPRWLIGDLHSHSEHSDGGVTVLDAIHRARTSGLDFVAITDHNATSQNAIRPDDPGILVIPAMELTTFFGHSNLLGLERPVADWRCRTPADVHERMAEARANGATVVLNHPFQQSAGGRWQAGFDGPFDAYEIWNGTWSVPNRQALDHWQAMLSAGRRVAAVGGSDFHQKNRRRHGHPANRLRTEASSTADILAAVRAGRTVVTYGPSDRMAVPVGSQCFGDALASGTPIAIDLTGLSIGDEIRMVSEAGTVETIAANASTYRLETRFSGRFRRFEVWHGEEPRLFTNPFYAE